MVRQRPEETMPAAWLVEVVMAEVVMVLVALALEVAAVADWVDQEGWEAAEVRQGKAVGKLRHVRSSLCKPSIGWPAAIAVRLMTVAPAAASRK